MKTSLMPYMQDGKQRKNINFQTVYPRHRLSNTLNQMNGRNDSTTDAYLKTLVTIKTKGISVLDDIQKSSGEVISFQDAVNKKR